MRQWSVGLGLGLVVLWLVVIGPGAVSALRAQQRNEPGLPTLARVEVLNRTPADAVAVMVQGAAVPIPTVTVRQNWEYRQVFVPAAQDASAALNTAGAEGWEAFTAGAGTGGTIWTMKRPIPVYKQLP